jgi:hypothetical protein
LCIPPAPADAVEEDGVAGTVVGDEDFGLPLLHATANRTTAHSIATLRCMTCTMI